MALVVAWACSCPAGALRHGATASLQEVSLREALESRATTRCFRPDVPLSDDVIRQILWAAEGTNRGGRDESRRTSPCSFGKRTITLYLATREGVFLHEPLTNTLQKVLDRDTRQDSSRLLRDRHAPYVLWMVGNVETLQSAASRAGYLLDPVETMNVLWADAAVIAENVHLACAALGVGAGIIADLDAEQIRRALGLDDAHVPVLAMALGMPAATDGTASGVECPEIQNTQAPGGPARPSGPQTPLRQPRPRKAETGPRRTRRPGGPPLRAHDCTSAKPVMARRGGSSGGPGGRESPRGSCAP